MPEFYIKIVRKIFFFLNFWGTAAPVSYANVFIGRPIEGLHRDSKTESRGVVDSYNFLVDAQI